MDLFRLVYRELERVGMQSALVGGVVLTGGGIETGRPVRGGGRGTEVPGAKGAAHRDPQLAGGDLRSGMGHGGGPGDVFGRLKLQGEIGAAVGRFSGQDVEVRQDCE